MKAAHPLEAEKALSRFEQELAGTPLWTIVPVLGAARCLAHARRSLLATARRRSSDVWGSHALRLVIGNALRLRSAVRAPRGVGSLVPDWNARGRPLVQDRTPTGASGAELA